MRLGCVFIFLFSIFTVSLTAQSAAPSPASALAVSPVSIPTNAALAAKAPGAPGYGLQIVTSKGKIMLTSLSFDPIARKPTARFYLITGPAGLGPYRAGIDFTFHPEQPIPANHIDPLFYSNYFFIVAIEKDGAAEKAGLKPNKYGLQDIVGVDGSNFGWDPQSLAIHISNSPAIDVSTLNIPLVFGHAHYKTYHIKTQKLETPVDPADGIIGPIAPDKEIQAWLNQEQTWKDLLILRSKQARFAPLAIDIEGRKLWVVRSEGAPDGKGVIPGFLEFWQQDPLTGLFATGIMDVWPDPPEGMQPGRILRVGDHWYRLKTFTQDPASHRLLGFGLEAWKADVMSLLSGQSPADEIGTVHLPGARESLEQAANDSLVEWKTRSLPDMLRTEQAPALEEMVIRTEKGVLALDLQTRTMRERLDAQARAQAAQQAQASMPGSNQPAPAAAAPSTADSEVLADLFDQRKAILQAILGSTKQALAQVRR